MTRAHFLKLISVAILGRHALPTPEEKSFPVTRAMIEDPAYKPAVTYVHHQYGLGYKVSEELTDDLYDTKRYWGYLMGGLK